MPGRMHHGWLITGPRGVGKATLAWRIARFLLATPEADEGGLFGDAPPAPETLDIATDHPVARRLLAGSDPGLFHITRTPNEKTGRMRDMIVADDVRRLNQFLQLSATDGGRRVVILDCADEMNVQAANALLKMLEEPPARTILLLISHQPSRLLPTIRSRCRELRLSPLAASDMADALAQADIDAPEDAAALAELSGGSVGEAVRLINLGGLTLYAELVAIIGTLPQLDRARALETGGGGGGPWRRRPARSAFWFDGPPAGAAGTHRGCWRPTGGRGRTGRGGGVRAPVFDAASGPRLGGMCRRDRRAGASWAGGQP